MTAIQVLWRLLPSQDIDALLGDIVEESRRRSRLWYWMQILAVIVVGSFRVVRAHRLLTLRAIAVGSGALVAYVCFWILLVWGLQTLAYGLYVGSHWIQLSNGVLHAMNRSFVASLWLQFLVGFSLCGWIVGRLHRQYGITLVLPLAGLVAFLLLALSVRSALSALRLGMPFHSLLLLYLTHAVLIPASIVLGGYWSTRRVKAA
jgi:hypothetical protein